MTRLNSLPCPTKADAFAGARVPPDLKIRGYTPDLAVEAAVRAIAPEIRKNHVPKDVDKEGASDEAELAPLSHKS